METSLRSPSRDALVDVRTGRRNTRSRSFHAVNKHSTRSKKIATFLTTVTIVQASASSSSETAFPTTTTWFPVQSEKSKRKRSDEDLAKSATQKRKKLGQAKRKRDRIQQEIDATQKTNRKLQAQLTAVNKRITQLQGVQARRPTAKDVR